ncbi:hypothetical protein PAXRUDRAFT_827643 [Paxillus rubicundulus Ve08.2h10]|uniref:Uncharacterized protein n=1 Tax=Paxillus rubicundulus Ve08.2h10 TaxID=930991 RepID=A0A0D0DC55_9AGAM|nr:hypothetical protein PAXRUDRAFT_827643 [Paxillus rubicundulus Ve08.2h10]
MTFTGGLEVSKAQFKTCCDAVGLPLSPRSSGEVVDTALVTQFRCMDFINETTTFDRQPTSLSDVHHQNEVIVRHPLSVHSSTANNGLLTCCIDHVFSTAWRLPFNRSPFIITRLIEVHVMIHQRRLPTKWLL